MSSPFRSSSRSNRGKPPVRFGGTPKVRMDKQPGTPQPQQQSIVPQRQQQPPTPQPQQQLPVPQRQQQPATSQSQQQATGSQPQQQPTTPQPQQQSATSQPQQQSAVLQPQQPPAQRVQQLQEVPHFQQQQQQLLTALVTQITALKESVEQLRNDTSMNQAETQRLRETVDRQVESNIQSSNDNERIRELQNLREESHVLSSNALVNTATNVQSFKKLYDLPHFSGKAEDWPLFLANYEETTINFGYSAVENTIRLQRCLQGEAREAVSSLLIHPSNAQKVVEALAFRFGRPEQLIKAQLTKVQHFPAISETRLEQLIPFSTVVENVVAFLTSAKCEQHLSNPMLLDELIMKLPMTRRFDWAQHASAIKPYATVKDLSNWLSQLARIVQLVPQPSTNIMPRNQTANNTRRMLHATTTLSVNRDSNTPKKICKCCGADHQLKECNSFKLLTIDDRWKLVKSKHVCFCCLRSGHGAATCRIKRRCDTNGCRRFHNKLLHEESTSPVRVHNCLMKNNSNQLFRILPVILLGPRGNKTVFAMFDEGSSVSILEEDVAIQLGLKGQMQSLTLQWFGNKVVTEPSRRVSLEIRGINSDAQCYQMRNVRTVPNLSLPIQSFDRDAEEHLKEIPVTSYKEARPVLLIGLDNCHLGVASSTIEGNTKQPIATCTKLGWVVYGPHATKNNDVPMVFCIREKPNLDKLDKLVESYFTIESLGICKNDSVLEPIDDTRAKQLLEKTTKRIGKRFETGLLWCKDDVVLPDSLNMATRRLHGIESKMKKDLQFTLEYKAQMNGYIEKGYARQLMPEEVKQYNGRTWYLPHFGVTNHHKPGKIRIVFDAAAEVNGTSLNSMLLKGPEQAKPLLSVLFQFRQGIVGVVADIKEMFSQVKICQEDQGSQRFLWRDGEVDQRIKTYVMTSMIFGAACSPCSAEHIKNKNAKEFENEYNEAVNIIVNNHYVDDFVCSFTNEAEAERISAEVQQIHAEGGFHLRSFLSNKKQVQSKLNRFSSSLQSSVSLELDKEVEKVLGMYWDTEEDTFRFRLKFHKIPKDVLNTNRPPTKREMLSIVMSVFDPYGFLADFLICSKILLQNTWKTGIGWDDPLPDNLHRQWKLWWQEVKFVEQFQIHRCYSPNIQHALGIELHIFTDASESAFAAVGYFRIQYEGNVDTAFAFGKTRCAPKKTLSIPRLELQAAVLGCRLQTAVKAMHSLNISRVVYWSDSKTILWWVKSSNRRFKPFVAHRVAEILETSSPSDWHWVPTDLNAADAATRAANPPRFLLHSRWLSGPDFLRLPEQAWPNDSTFQVPDKLDEELRPKMLHINQASNLVICFSKFSSLSRLKRIAAWLLRYIHSLLRLARETIAARQKYIEINLASKGSESVQAEIIAAKQKPNKINLASKLREPVEREELTAAEITSAERFLCKHAQIETFREEITALKKENKVSRKSTIYQLTPQLDQDDVLRVYGRIDAACCLPEDARRPIILPRNHAFTHLVIDHYHHRLHHQNDALVINEIRQRYWITNIRVELKHVKRKCQRCKIAKAKPINPLMGQLPVDRVTPYVRPFTYTGLDYFGPLQVSVGRRKEKRWVAIFTCLTIRAIHLELAADLSTDAFILCLRNFINRRGTPVRIRSDNGTNFVGAKRELNREAELFDTDRIQNEMSMRGIEWKFSCPLNPSEGGIWERMVQSVKKVLSVTLQEEAPRVETLRSLLIEAENIVNSRPLTELPLTSEEDEPLTPNHFLIGSLNSTQTPSNQDEPICCRKQWMISQQLKDRFWKKWIQGYLPMLTRRTKWHERVVPLKVDDLVIICDVSQPRSRWQRGRVVRVYPGKDGQVRSADVKTSHGTFHRPSSKLAVLDVDGEPLRGFTEGGMSARM